MHIAMLTQKHIPNVTRVDFDKLTYMMMSASMVSIKSGLFLLNMFFLKQTLYFFFALSIEAKGDEKEMEL